MLMKPRPRPARQGWLGSRTGSCIAVAAAITVSACAAAPDTLHLAAFTPDELADGAPWRAAVLERDDSGAESTERAALVIGATREELVAARLDREPREARQWRVETAVVSPPVLAHGMVVFGTRRDFVALSAEDGRRLWSVPSRASLLVAAAADAEHTALLTVDARRERSLSVYGTPWPATSPEAGQQQRAARARRPREQLRVTADGPLGAPAFRAGALLVPWGEGHVSAIDVAAVSELAQIRLGSRLLHGQWIDGVLYVGGPPWTALARDGALPYALPRRPLPGNVQSSAIQIGAPLSGGPEQAAAPSESPQSSNLQTGSLGGPPSSGDVTRLYPHPARAGASGTPDIYLGTYGRLAFGVERARGTLEWVLALPGRALAATAVAGGFLVCDDAGGVRLLAPETGRVARLWQIVRQRRISLGETALSACALSAGTVLPTGRARRAGSAAAAEPAPEPLLDQLSRVLALNDPGLTDAQRFLARELAARPEPEATRVLIDLVTRHSLDRVLQSEAEDLLATRRNGQDYMLAALRTAGARGPSLPPIAPLGEALAALGERRAAPLLAAQLNRPAHASSAIARAAEALEELASDAELGELSVFFSLHRTTADGPEWVAAVVSVARTLLRVGGQRTRTLIDFAIRDPLTIADVREALERELGSKPAGS
jgi:outer membrane protein assembly factor BamB